MSVIRPILRMCAVAALKENTWAQERVTDSDSTPLLDALKGETPKPYITIYTDDDVRTQLQGRDFFSADRRINLVIESGLANTVLLDQGQPAELRIPQTSEAMELLLDMLETQIIDALFMRPGSQWRSLIEKIVNKIDRVPSIRGGSTEKGTRWAARSITFVCDVVSDPVPGVALPAGHPVLNFMTLAATNPVPGMELDKVVDILKKVFDPATPPANIWTQIEALLSTTPRHVKNIGLGPVMDQPPEFVDQSEPELTEVIRDPVDPSLEPPPPKERPDLNYKIPSPPTPEEP